MFLGRIHLTVALFALATLFATELGANDAGPSVVVTKTLFPADAGVAGAQTQEPLLPPLTSDRMPTLEFSTEPVEVAVGDIVTWKAVIRRRVGDRVHLSRAASFGGFEIQGKDDMVGEASDDWLKETLIVNLISFEAGDMEIPTQRITVLDIDGRVAEMETEPVTVSVKSLIANEPEPQMKPDTGEGVPVYEDDYTLLYVLGALGVIIAIALLTLLGRKLWSMRRPRRGPPPPPPRPAEEIALEKLEAIRESSHLEEDRYKLFHVLLSEAFREYLGNRYRFHSLDRSTEELVMEMRKPALHPELFERIIELLAETDFVKFAKYIPGRQASLDMLEEAFSVVHITTPKPSTPTSAKKQEGDNG